MLTVSQELVELERQSLKNLQQVETLMLSSYGRRLPAVSQLDRYRLLMLRIWSEKYKVSLRFILGTLLPFYWSKVSSKHANSKWGFGIRLATLLSGLSEQILSDAVKRTYPDKGNIAEWRWQRRTRMIAAGQPLQREDPLADDQFMARYDEQIRARRKELIAAVIDEAHRRHCYRDNPWTD